MRKADYKRVHSLQNAVRATVEKLEGRVLLSSGQQDFGFYDAASYYHPTDAYVGSNGFIRDYSEDAISTWNLMSNAALSGAQLDAGERVIPAASPLDVVDVRTNIQWPPITPGSVSYDNRIAKVLVDKAGRIIVLGQNQGRVGYVATWTATDVPNGTGKRDEKRYSVGTFVQDDIWIARYNPDGTLVNQTGTNSGIASQGDYWSRMVDKGQSHGGSFGYQLGDLGKFGYPGSVGAETSLANRIMGSLNGIKSDLNDRVVTGGIDPVDGSIVVIVQRAGVHYMARYNNDFLGLQSMIELPAMKEEIRDIRILSDRSVVLVGPSAGWYLVNGGPYTVARRFSAEGALLNEYTVPQGELTSEDSIYGVATDAQDRVYLIGNTDDSTWNPSSGFSKMTLFRLSKEGALDTVFNQQVKVQLNDFGRKNVRGIDVQVQDNGKILVMVWLDNVADINGTYDSTILARFNPTGTIDTTFAGAGRVVISPSGATTWLGTEIVVQSDGAIVVGGLRDGANFEALRYLANGQRDNGFGSAGFAQMPTPAGLTASNSSLYAGKWGPSMILNRPNTVYGDDKILMAWSLLPDAATDAPANPSSFIITRLLAQNLAPGAALQAEDIQSAGTRYSFLVTFSDDEFVRRESLGNLASDIDYLEIYAPDGTKLTAPIRLDGVTPMGLVNYDRDGGGSADNRSFTCTYSFAWPASFPVNGKYSVKILSAKVSDANVRVNETPDFRYVVAGTLGGFLVNIVTPDNQGPNVDFNYTVGVTNRNDVATGIVVSGRAYWDFGVVYTDASGVDLNTIGDKNLLIVGPRGYEQYATVVGNPELQDGTRRVLVRYRVLAPNAVNSSDSANPWDPTDNGLYTIYAEQTSIGDVVGNFVSADAVGQFSVALRNDVNVYPTARLENTPLASVTTAGKDAYQFEIRYSSSTYSPLDVLTIINNNAALVVTGPNAFQGNATYVSHVVELGGDYVVTYGIQSADENWDVADNGNWQISIQAQQVGDSESPKNFVQQKTLGAFAVSIADVQLPTATIGATVIPPLPGSDRVLIQVRYTDNQAIDVASINSGDLLVQRTAGGSLLSLAGVGTPTVTENGKIVTVTYSYAAPGGAWNFEDNGEYSITLKPDQVRDIAGNAVAQTALGSFAFADKAPVATATFGPIVAGGQNFVLTVTYTDETGVDWTTIDAGDITIARVSNGVYQVLQLVNLAGVQNPTVNTPTNGTPRIATYTFAPPGGFWEWRDNGFYQIRLNAGEVKDTGGAAVVGEVLASFELNLPQDSTIPTVAITSAPNIVLPGASSYSFEVTYSDNVAVDLQTILNGQDIKVVAPNGKVFDAQLVAGSVTAIVSGSPIRARYQIMAPNGIAFTADDNGTWVIRMQPNGVADVSGNAVGSGPIGTFTITVPDNLAPTVVIESGLSAPISLTSTHQIVVVYSDSNGIDLTSINAADIVVTHTSGTTLASAGAPVAVPLNPNNTSVRVTYTFTAPGGTWNYQDVGEYEVAMVAGKVRDTSNNAVDPEVLGTFTFADAPPQATLLLPKPTVVIGTASISVIVEYSDEVLVDNATFGAGDIRVTTTLANGTTAKLVSAGAPVAVQTGNTGEKWMVTYTFLPLGGYWESRDNGTYTISLLPNEVADGGGQFSQGGDLGTFKVAFAVDTAAPTAVLVNPVTLVVPAPTYSFVVRYTDAVAVDYRTISIGDVIVEGPDGLIYQATLVGFTPAAFAASLDATYSITKVGGFSVLDNGVFTVKAVAAQVADMSGNFIAGGTNIGVFVIANAVPPVTATIVTVGPVAATATSMNFVVSYSSTYNLDTSTLIGNNNVVRVTGPKNFVAFATFVSINNSAPGLTRTVTYSIAAPGGAWDFSDNGTYTIAIVPNNGVENIVGGKLAAVTLTTFVAASQSTVLSGSTLTINGTDASDTIELMMLNGTDATPANDIIQVIVNNVMSRYDRALVGSINIVGLAGNDTIKLNSLVPAALIKGGAGNDTIWGGDGHDTIYGDDGDDYIVGGAAGDMIFGGNGNDRLIGGAGWDTLFGGAGDDNISGGSGKDHLFGGAGNDTLTGGKGVDYLNGEAGDDWFYSRDGEFDFIIGGAGFNRAQVDSLDAKKEINQLLA